MWTVMFNQKDNAMRQLNSMPDFTKDVLKILLESVLLANNRPITLCLRKYICCTWGPILSMRHVLTFLLQDWMASLGSLFTILIPTVMFGFAATQTNNVSAKLGWPAMVEIPL
jgi:hypothetical protein